MRTAVGLVSIQLSILVTSECFRHALVISALTWRKCLIGTVAHLALCASATASLFLSDHMVVVFVPTTFVCTHYTS